MGDESRLSLFGTDQAFHITIGALTNQRDLIRPYQDEWTF